MDQRAVDQVDQKDLFLRFWDKEAIAMREVIKRIPQERCDYRADPKGRTAREIAWLIVREEAALGDGLHKGVLEWQEVPAPATMQEILDAYDREHPVATKRMKDKDASAWAQPIPFMFGGEEVMRASGFENAWGFLFDLIHHRGQLSTMLRPMGSTVPQIYGPSADEP